MKIKKSTYLPIALFIYLLVLAYFGRDMLERGKYFSYFSVFGLTTIVIIILHFALKQKEKQQANRTRKKNDQQYSDNKTTPE